MCVLCYLLECYLPELSDIVLRWTAQEHLYVPTMMIVIIIIIAAAVAAASSHVVFRQIVNLIKRSSCNVYDIKIIPISIQFYLVCAHVYPKRRSSVVIWISFRRACVCARCCITFCRFGIVTSRTYLYNITTYLLLVVVENGPITSVWHIILVVLCSCGYKMNRIFFIVIIIIILFFIYFDDPRVLNTVCLLCAWTMI